jgi:hypothetical protein
VNNFTIAELREWQPVRLIHPSKNGTGVAPYDLFGKLRVLKTILKEGFGHGRASV